MQLSNINNVIETFEQRSLSQFKIFITVCAAKRFKNCNWKCRSVVLKYICTVFYLFCRQLLERMMVLSDSCLRNFRDDIQNNIPRFEYVSFFKAVKNTILVYKVS